MDSIASDIALHTVKHTNLTKKVKRDADLPEVIRQHLSAVSRAGGLFALGETRHPPLLGVSPQRTGTCNAENMTQDVTTELLGRTFVVTINRPRVRNAVDRVCAAHLADAFRTFERDDDASVAVLAGAGGTFCSGADLAAIAAGQMNHFEADGDGPMGPTRMSLRKPVIAAIDGYAVAGGLELALWCDLRVMERDAILGVFCRRYGVPLVDGGTVRLSRIIGLGRALDLILTGRAVDAEEAHAIGLVTKVVKHGQARRYAIELAEQIAQFPETCVREDRLSTYESLNLSLTDALRVEYLHGRTTVDAGLSDAELFTHGEGRHGSFGDD